MATQPASDTPYVTVAEEKKFTPTTKSYNSSEFLNSHEARSIRIMCEFEEPARRLAQHGVLGTLLFFGSARSMMPEDYAATVAQINEQLKTADDATKAQLEARLGKLKKTEWMCASYNDIRELARKLAEWAKDNQLLRARLLENPPMYTNGKAIDPNTPPLIVTTGGGPGFMEAANQGAAQSGAHSMGMAISLPFEKGVNQFVSPELAFEFHYFFTRKFWMMYSAKALIIAPGGFGTCDELFEMLTLKQTGKVARMPVVLFGATYWKTVINWQAMVDHGTISQEDYDELLFTDDVEEAYKHVTTVLEKEATGVMASKVPKEQRKGPNAVQRMHSMSSSQLQESMQGLLEKH